MLAAATELTREIFGNHPPLSRAIFYVLSLLSVAIFGWGFYRRVRLWRLGQPTEVRLSFAAIVSNLIRYALFQSRVRGRGTASLGHILLFAGFLVLLLGTTLLAIEHGLATLLGRPADAPLFHKGVYYAIYEMTTDAFGLALLAGGVILAVRRWRRPASLAHHWSDWAILAALLVLGVTGYVVEGLRIIREQTVAPGFSFIGWLAAQSFASLGLGPNGAAHVHFVVWWFHALLALGFVALFPYTRLQHALAGTVRLAAGPVALGVMVKLDIEEVEKTGVVGVGKIEQFTRRQLLELDACVSCGRCEDACPAFEAGKPLSPRNVVQDLRKLLQTEGERPALHGDTIRAETVWSCTTCSACAQVCPLAVNPLGLITDMRRHLIGEAQLRGSPAQALQKTDRSGNPWGLPAQDRLSWAAGLNVPTVASDPDFEVLYWVGCAAAYDPRIQRIARSVVRLLSAAKVHFAVLGSEERCTGESARRLGDEFLFQQMATTNIETLAAHGVKRGAKKIVAHCPHCVNSLKQDYSQLGSDYEVVHHSEFLARLVAEGHLPLKPTTNHSGPITYHDPCYLARVGGVTEAPRQLLQLTVRHDPNRELIEMPRHGQQTACCGAGGGRMWFDDAPDKRIGIGRVREALATGAGTVAVSCPFCMIMMTDGVAARDPRVRVRDIAELLAESLVPETAAKNEVPEQPQPPSPSIS
jgi:Fe-S oxidoreductase/nitrate reductase gamma subunit